MGGVDGVWEGGEAARLRRERKRRGEKLNPSLTRPSGPRFSQQNVLGT